MNSTLKTNNKINITHKGIIVSTWFHRAKAYQRKSPRLIDVFCVSRSEGIHVPDGTNDNRQR